MAVNYLQYISSVHQTDQTAYPNMRFLVSGVDAGVRETVGRNIVTSCCSRGKAMFIADNTQSMTDFPGGFGGYRVVNILNGEVGLCSDLLEVNSIKGISRLRSLLSSLGFDGSKAMQVVTYLSFVKETERRLGNTAPLTADVLEEYGSTTLVQWKLSRLVERGELSRENKEYLLCRYAEVSGTAADFEMFLALFAPFLDGAFPTPDMAVHLPLGVFASDKPMQELMCKLMLSYIKRNRDDSAVLILDDSKGERSCLMDMLRNLPITTEAHMISNDAFSLGEVDLGVLMNTFPVRIYTRHEDMASCGRIEKQCGQIDAVKRSSTVTVDKRIGANSAWDILLGTNRTETEIRNAPVKEYRFRKETIQSLSERTGIIDCGGNQVLFSF